MDVRVDTGGRCGRGDTDGRRGRRGRRGVQ